MIKRRCPVEKGVLSVLFSSGFNNSHKVLFVILTPSLFTSYLIPFTFRSAINPILYNVLSAKFRSSFKKAICKNYFTRVSRTPVTRSGCFSSLGQADTRPDQSNSREG